MNILVVGPGAIGSLWAHSLAQAGHNLSLWSRNESNHCSVTLDGHAPLLLTNNQTDSVSDADIILVTVKAPQVTEALSPLLSTVSPDAIVVLMHNGMGTAEHVETALPNNPIVLATTTHGAYKDDTGLTHHTGVGVTHLGGYNFAGKQCGFLQEVLEHALPAASWTQDIHAALWNKLAINCAINPLTAIHQVNNGQLALDKFHSQLQDIVTEVVHVMQAEGIEISYEQIKQKVDSVIEATARNHSSMKQDIALKRSSEIDFITGYLLQRAQAHKIAAPNNAALYNQIKQIELSWKSS